MAEIMDLGSLQINYGKDRTINIQMPNNYGDIIDMGVFYTFYIFLNRNIETEGDTLEMENDRYGISLYKSITKQYCDYYIVCQEEMSMLGEGFTYVFDYIEYLCGSSSFNICVDFYQLDLDFSESAIKEVFLACAHWSRLMESLTKISINFSDGNAFLKTAAKMYFKAGVEIYSDIQSLKFESEEDNLLFTQMKEETNAHIEELSEKPYYLNDNELFAIVLYSSNFYSVINRALRNPVANADEYNVLRGVFLHIDTGLWQFEQYNGKAWRGDNLNADRKKENEPGNYVTNLAYTSTSVNTSNEFAQNSSEIFEFELIDGSSISNISMYPDEDEVLLKAHMTYYVKSNSKTFEETGKPLYEVDEEKELRR